MNAFEKIVRDAERVREAGRAMAAHYAELLNRILPGAQKPTEEAAGAESGRGARVCQDDEGREIVVRDLTEAEIAEAHGEGRSAGRGEYKKRELREFVRCGNPGRVCAVMRSKGTTPAMQKALTVAAVHLGLLAEDVPAAALHRLFAVGGAAKVAHVSTIGRAIRAYLAGGKNARLQMPRCSRVPDAVMRDAWDALAQFDCGTQYSG